LSSTALLPIVIRTVIFSGYAVSRVPLSSRM